MDIAVIGDYNSPTKYRNLMMTVKVMKPDDKIIDLSRHESIDWGLLKQARFTDISNAHLVVSSSDWRDHFESRNDVHHAMELNKQLLFEQDGKFIEYSDYTNSL